MSRPITRTGKGNASLLLMGVLLALAFGAITLLLALQRHSLKTESSIPSRTDFSRTDAWVALGGAWSARTAEVQNASEERGAKLMTRLGAWEDYQVQADLQLAEAYGEAGLIIRSADEEEGVDSYHGYFADIRTMDSSLELGRADFGWLPLLHKGLPVDADLHGWIHLRLVAVGCKLGVAVTLPDKRSSAAVIEDPHCIHSGRFGLRSSLTSAKWRNLEVSRATPEDLKAVEAKTNLASEAGNLALADSFDLSNADRYASSIRAEAKKHAVQPGVQPIVSFLLSPGRHPNVTIQGVVISTPPLTDIQDDSGALIIPNVDSKVSLKLGDVVEAQGTVISERFRSRLEDAKIRVLWSDMPIPPLAVTASQLTSGTYRGRSITVEGTLVSATSQAAGYELVLKDGDLVFRALGSSDFQLNPAGLESGGRLRLRGTATSLSRFTNNIYPFTIITDRVDVLSAPPWWSPRHVMWVILACIALFLCAQLLLHRLQQWHMQSVLREREQLAFEMHDTLAQSFTGIAYQLQAASIERRGESQIQVHIRNALQMVHLSHKEASRTIAALRPQYRDAAAILSALKESAERLSDGGAIVITAALTGKSSKLPLHVTDALFRIGQEAISNAIQHADCKVLIINLGLSKREAQLEVQDDGRGYLGQTVNEGLGIAGMRNRAAKIKARFDIRTGPGEGTTVTVTAPLPIGGGLWYGVRAMLKPSSRA